MGRMILAVVVALITASAIFLLVLMIATPFGPQPPKNLEYLNNEKITQYFSTLPIGAYLTVALGFLLGSFAGGWIVAKISKHAGGWILPIVLGVLLTLGGVVFFLRLPGQPLWFTVLSLLIYLPFVLLGYKFAR
jgi:hypothetical protein